jgi:hypothetical protein
MMSRLAGRLLSFCILMMQRSDESHQIMGRFGAWITYSLPKLSILYHCGELHFEQNSYEQMIDMCRRL